ncbi:hypothetical protein [Spirillospora sp. NPDC029432]|uniref:hypothetical protein n=1 Tax=Spirillospora sp. NPDC029432 TaxID=3154599 RepID=UPI0034551140
MTDRNRASLEGSRPPVRISGPAHRRPGTSPLRRRHVWGWGVLAVALIAVTGQWIAGGLGDRPAGGTNRWAGPPPGPWRPGVPAVTVSPSSSPSPSPSRPSARPKAPRRTAAVPAPAARRRPAGRPAR